MIRILEGYLGKLEQGCPPHPDDLVAEYPELGDTLRAYLDKLALLHNAATGLRPPMDVRMCTTVIGGLPAQ